MAGGGGGGTLWIKVLIGGALLVAVAMGLEHQHTGPTWLVATLLATGGLGVVFGSCEAMILCVQGVGQRAGWNPFVAGTMGGLASNIPENNPNDDDCDDDDDNSGTTLAPFWRGT